MELETEIVELETEIVEPRALVVLVFVELQTQRTGGRVNGGGSGGVRSLIDAVFTWDASMLWIMKLPTQY